jgi:hypothetical protein
MKKLMLICAVVLGFTITASAQTDNKAEFKFAEEKHDFGKIPQGKPVTYAFAYTNTGEEPLIISDVKPTCGCTIADFTKTPVLKNGKGVITITFNAAVVTVFNKTIVVTSNAKTPQKFLVITGEVVSGPTATGSK